jgi:hypothetical protein
MSKTICAVAKISYSEKRNPIEHRAFPHVTCALSGVPLNSVEDAKSKISLAKTKTGLAVVADVILTTYQTRKKAAKDFMNHMKNYIWRIIAKTELHHIAKGGSWYVKHNV